MPKKSKYKEKAHIHIICEKKTKEDFYQIANDLGYGPNEYFNKMMKMVIEAAEN